MKYIISILFLILSTEAFALSFDKEPLIDQDHYNEKIKYDKFIKEKCGNFSINNFVKSMECLDKNGSIYQDKLGSLRGSYGYCRNILAPQTSDQLEKIYFKNKEEFKKARRGIDKPEKGEITQNMIKLEVGCILEILSERKFKDYHNKLSLPLN